mgnify:CR=1 FL=1
MEIGKEITQKAFKSPQEKAIINILFTSNWYERMTMHTLKPHGLSGEQYNVLRILRGNKGEPYRLKDIQHRMINRTSNTTRLVEKLRVKNLIQREVSKQSRREVLISITNQGLELLSEIDAGMEDIQARLILALPPEKAELLSDILDEFRTVYSMKENKKVL